MTKSSTAYQTINPEFKLTEKQGELVALSRDPRVDSLMAAGGIRSGKTAGFCFETIYRAMNAKKSRHGVFHAQLNVCRRNLLDLSFPEMFELMYPGFWSMLEREKRINRTDSVITLPNDSKILFFGLDDAQKIRGQKMSTAWINEGNLGVTYRDFITIQGRLSEVVQQLDGTVMNPKMFIDLNPTVKSSWEYQLFVEKLIPEDRTPLWRSSRYQWVHMNPADNVANLGQDYITKTFAGYTAEQRSRDEHGLWSEDNPNALFDLKKIRRERADCDFSMIVVAIDPAGSSHEKSDMTGIVVAALGEDGHFYVLEDATMKGKPEDWALKAAQLYKDYDADWIVAEKNFGGDMVRTVLERSTIGGHNLPIKLVTAKRGKKLRAEPVAVLYEKALVHHVELFRPLEQQMVEFDSPGFKGSPDRVDALVWALTFLSEQQTGPSSGAFVGYFGR